jgi:hypothetical protein
MTETQTQIEYKEVTVTLINELAEDSYCKEHMYEFIAKHGEDAFYNYYVTYVEMGECHSYEAVDTFIEEFSVDDLNSFEDSYRGQWESRADYAENFVTDCYSVDFPSFIEIDWENTFENLDCVYVNGFVFDNQF